MDSKHGIPYGYFLNKVFKYFLVECVRGVSGTVKQMFTMNTLIENSCIKVRVCTRSHVFELLDIQKCLTRELDEMMVVIATIDTENT